jgi:hypothetical protein
MYFIIALSALSTILSSFIYVFITRQWFKPEYDALKYIIGWYGLKTYTKINMYVKKISKIKHYFYNTTDDIIDIYIISNGYRVDTISNKNVDLSKIPTYDFICYEVNKEDESKYLIIRDKISNEKVEDIEKSNVRFLAPQLFIDNSQTLIEFTQNIYLVNNKIFSRPFIRWYMNAFHDTFVDDKQEYVIRFFDNKMDFIEINSEQCVILGKDTYEIVKYESSCETEASETADEEASETADEEAADEEAGETASETASETADEEAASETASETEEEEAEDEDEEASIASVPYIRQERGC